MCCSTVATRAFSRALVLQRYRSLSRRLILIAIVEQRGELTTELAATRDALLLEQWRTVLDLVADVPKGGE